MDGWELRERRRRAGLTLRQLARAAGTSETNLSAYERGTKRPAGRTIGRLSALLDAGADSPIFAMNLVTAPTAGAELRRGLKQGWGTGDLLRVVREMRNNTAHLEDAADRAAFLAEPSTTGDPRWDALMAGNAEDLALRMKTQPPAWTRGHALPQFWFVSSLPSLHVHDFAHSPFPMQVRGVMIDPASLESA